MVEELRIVPIDEISAEQALAMMIHVFDMDGTATSGVAVKFPPAFAHHVPELERRGWIRRRQVGADAFWLPTKLGRRHAATLGIKSIGDDAGHA